MSELFLSQCWLNFVFIFICPGNFSHRYQYCNTMPLNINVGLLGHVDSGKTSLCRVLSNISSTAAFDKNPQSQERGITLDLGFSALTVDMPAGLKRERKDDSLVFCFVDCPGHQSLIKTIIGGSQIIGKYATHPVSMIQPVFSF